MENKTGKKFAELKTLLASIRHSSVFERISLRPKTEIREDVGEEQVRNTKNSKLQN